MRSLGVILALAGPGDGPVRFTDVTEAAGLVEPLAGLLGHGAAWGDFDGDGRPDLFVGGFCDRPAALYHPAPGPVPSRLLRRRGDGGFERAGQPAAECHARTSGAVFADLDNDGDLDLYVANNARARASRQEEPQRTAQLRRSVLLRNDGGTFADVSSASGACPEDLRRARNVGVFDYDGDGLLDLLVLEDFFAHGDKPPRSVLLRNRGGLRFEEANRAAGLPDDLYGLGHAAADLNGDHRADFFVAHSNRLFLSGPGGTYREASDQREVFAWKPAHGEDWPCGAAFGDLDGDGDFDLVVSHHSVPGRLRLFLNDGAARFREATREAGLDALLPTKVPHVEIRDFDNDGRPDLYVSAAWVEEGRIVPLVYRNRGGLRFEAPRPLRGSMICYPAGPSADYDGDGRLDLFLVNWSPGRRCALLRNATPGGHWLGVRVTGRTFNRMGLGAKVRLMESGRLLGVQEIAIGCGYASGHQDGAHFGLGERTSVDLQVTLPNGKEVFRAGVQADQMLVVEEP